MSLNLSLPDRLKMLLPRATDEVSEIEPVQDFVIVPNIGRTPSIALRAKCPDEGAFVGRVNCKRERKQKRSVEYPSGDSRGSGSVMLEPGLEIGRRPDVNYIVSMNEKIHATEASARRNADLHELREHVGDTHAAAFPGSRSDHTTDGATPITLASAGMFAELGDEWPLSQEHHV